MLSFPLRLRRSRNVDVVESARVRLLLGIRAVHTKQRAFVPSSIGEVSLQAKCSELTNYGYLPLAAASETR